MAIQTHKPDAMTIALFLAAAAHAIVILGIGFEPFLDELRTPPALEVVLVQKTDSEAPDEADYLAQTSQDGGGESDPSTRPASPFTSPTDSPEDGIAPAPMQASSPRPEPVGDDAILTNVFSDEQVRQEDTAEKESTDSPRLDRVLVEQNFDIAKLAAEIERQQEEFAKRPKKKYLTARTQEAASAEYMYRWVETVERIGNLNYPESVRLQRLAGSLVLTVGIYKNGDIESVVIDESSGYAILDDAASTIVRLAGPYEPLTGDLARETDILYITRTWEFQSSNQVISY